MMKRIKEIILSAPSLADHYEHISGLLITHLILTIIGVIAFIRLIIFPIIILLKLWILQ